MSDKETVAPKISIELAAEAQKAYAQNAKKDQEQKGKPAQLGLDSGWGGKGR